MRYSKFIVITLAAVTWTALLATDASAQSRGHSGGGGHAGGARSGGGHAGGGGGQVVGRAVPRGGGGVRVDGHSYGSRVVVTPRGGVHAPLHSYYYPYYGYGYGYGYGYRPGLSIGFSFGYPYYGYGYPYAYGISYGGYYPYGYAYGAYPAYGAAVYRGDVYGGIRIQGAARGAQVYVDGYYAGVVDDFDGTFQRLSLDQGPHTIEVRAPGAPPLTYDVNVQPGQTVTIHANVR